METSYLATAAVASRTKSSQSLLRLGRRYFLVLLLSAFFLYHAAVMVPKYIGILELVADHSVPILDGSDFPAFYGGTKLLLHHPSGAYDPDEQQRYIDAAKGYGSVGEDDSPWYRYYNPPFFSLLLAPFTLLDLRVAFALTLLINLIGLGLLLKVVLRICGGRSPTSLLLCAAIITCVPTNYAFWHAQPTLFLASAFGLAWLMLEEGRPRRAGIFWAMLLTKPQWAVSTGLEILRRDRHALPSFLVVAILLGLPFLIIGPAGIRDYVAMMLGRVQGDVANESFAEAVLSWSGFFRGLTGEAVPIGWLVMSALTLSLYAVVLRRGAPNLLPAATMLTTALVVPHSHPQDWIMLAPAAAFLLRDRRSTWVFGVTAVLLLGVYLGLDNWSGLARGNTAFYWPTLTGFLLLVWVTMLSQLPQPMAKAEQPADEVILEVGAAS